MSRDSNAGCGQPATVRIEAYSPRDGRMHGSLDGMAYTCDADADRAADAITAAGFTPYRMAVVDLHQIEVGVEPIRCGRGIDFTGDKVRIFEAPEPKPVPEVTAEADRPLDSEELAMLVQHKHEEGNNR